MRPNSPAAWIRRVGDDSFDAYLARWREATPSSAVAWLFLRHAERIRYGGLAALEYEWRRAAHDVREPQVAAAKLGWWREELQRAVEGQSRHPLTQRLFAEARMRAIPLRFWTAPVDAVTASLFASAPADFPAQRHLAAPLANALAALETRAWFGREAAGERAAGVIALTGLVANARALETEVGHGRSPLPMNLLARHGLTLDGVATDAPPRRAALRDYLADLRRELARAATIPGPLALFRAMELQHDLDALTRALVAPDPLPALRKPAHSFSGVLKTWRAARMWRGTTQTGPDP